LIIITLLVIIVSGWVAKESFSQPLVAVEGEYKSYKQTFKVRDRSDR